MELTEIGCGRVLRVSFWRLLGAPNNSRRADRSRSSIDHGESRTFAVGNKMKTSALIVQYTPIVLRCYAVHKCGEHCYTY